MTSPATTFASAPAGEQFDHQVAETVPSKRHTHHDGHDHADVDCGVAETTGPMSMWLRCKRRDHLCREICAT
jgi:hypothetical protein